MPFPTLASHADILVLHYRHSDAQWFRSDMSPNQTLRLIALLHYFSIASLIALIALCLAWEAWLAPLKAGGSALILKVVPLLFPLFGILRGRRYTYQWSALLIWLYFTEGAVRAWSDTGLSAQLAGAEIALALVFFISVSGYARLSRTPALPSLNPEDRHR